jgi:hypothetical protein
MADPLVETNPGVLEKGGKVSKAGQPVHNFPDQLIVDGATVGPGKTPKVTTVSNKSRVWPERLGAAEQKSISDQVIADAEEALSKYGGEITLRRPTGPLAPLYNQTVKVDQVILVYDKTYVLSSQLDTLIRDAAAGVKSPSGQRVIVIIR